LLNHENIEIKRIAFVVQNKKSLMVYTGSKNEASAVKFHVEK